MVRPKRPRRAVSQQGQALHLLSRCLRASGGAPRRLERQQSCPLPRWPPQIASGSQQRRCTLDRFAAADDHGCRRTELPSPVGGRQLEGGEPGRGGGRSGGRAAPAGCAPHGCSATLRPRALLRPCSQAATKATIGPVVEALNKSGEGFAAGEHRGVTRATLARRQPRSRESCCPRFALTLCDALPPSPMLGFLFPQRW